MPGPVDLVFEGRPPASLPRQVDELRRDMAALQARVAKLEGTFGAYVRASSDEITWLRSRVGSRTPPASVKSAAAG